MMKSNSTLLFLCGVATGLLASLVMKECMETRPRRDHGSRGGRARQAGNWVRDAGPAHMDNPPRQWDKVDEEADQSFPASDPPGNY